LRPDEHGTVRCLTHARDLTLGNPTVALDASQRDADALKRFMMLSPSAVTTVRQIPGAGRVTGGGCCMAGEGFHSGGRDALELPEARLAHRGMCA